MTLAWLGVLVSAAASFFSAAANHVIKIAHLKANTTGTPYYCAPTIYIGAGILIVGAILNAVSYSLASQSLLAPTAGFTLIFNVLLNPYLAKEPAQKTDVIGTAVILLGVTVSVVFGPQNNDDRSVSDLLALYTRPTFVVYACVVVGLLVALYLSSRHYVLGVFAPYSHPALAGILAGWLGLLVKSGADVITSALHGGSDLANPLAYALIPLAACVTYAQLYNFNGALQRYEAMLVVPLYQTFMILSGVANGAIYFNEIAQLSLVSYFLFPIGVLIAISGLFVVSRRLGESPHPHPHSQIQGSGGGGGEFAFSMLAEVESSSSDESVVLQERGVGEISSESHDPATVPV